MSGGFSAVVGSPRLQPGYSAPGPTCFLCWCKESRPRKHLAVGGASGGRSLALQPLGCSLSQRIARQGDLDTLWSLPASARWTRCTQQGAREAPRARHPTSRRVERAGAATRPTATKSPCRAILCEIRRTTGQSASDRSPLAPPHARCFLCFLSLHQQRKGVARGGEIPACNAHTHKAAAGRSPPTIVRNPSPAERSRSPAGRRPQTIRQAESKTRTH